MITHIRIKHSRYTPPWILLVYQGPSLNTMYVQISSLIIEPGIARISQNCTMDFRS
jgi:hypothetical protein